MGPKFSSSRIVKCGVPQGSDLGPLLFKVFVIVLLYITLTNISCMYADDMQIVSTVMPCNIRAAITELELDLTRIINWSDQHGLRIHPAKCTLLVLGSPSSLEKLPSISVTLGSLQLYPSDSIRNLGLTFDPLLSYSNHVSSLCRQAYSRLRLLYPARHILSSAQKLLVSQSLIISLFDYYDVVCLRFM